MTTKNPKQEEGLVKALEETRKKVQVSLTTSIQDHVKQFDRNAGLDFLDTKNTLLLSYLIELTVMQRNRLLGKDEMAANSHAHRNRLLEMRTVLDKMRGLDKKLKYQIEKLLAVEHTASSFATVEDPLHYRPDAAALEAKPDDDDSSSDEDGDDDDKKEEANESDEEMDDDLKAAQKTLSMAKAKQSIDKSADGNDKAMEGGDADGVYRAPRLTAVPYTHDRVDKEAERERRQRRRSRASELAQTLRTQYGEAPEQEDFSGGTELGKQREAAKRLAAKEAAKTRYEEESMVRLTTTRKEKKARKRLMREETSNLSAIADLGNLVRDSNNFSDDRRSGRHSHNSGDNPMSEERHANGKRIRQAIDADGKAVRESKSGFQTKNSLQAALYKTPGSRSHSKKPRGGGGGGNSRR